MFRLSSSSTAGLWLSLLRKNTRITFWTIVTLLRCWGFLSSNPPLHKLFSVFSLLVALWMLKPACRAPRSAHPKRKHRVPPRVQKSDYLGVITFKAPHREKSPVARKISRVRASSVKKKGAFPLKSSLVVLKLQEMEVQREERCLESRRCGGCWALWAVLSQWGPSTAFYTCTILMWRGGTEEEIPHARPHTDTCTRINLLQRRELKICVSLGTERIYTFRKTWLIVS